MKITEDMIIGDVLKLDRGSAPVFLRNGMHCLGCPSSTGESIKDACLIHGLDSKKIVNELNEYFATKN
jgi:hybrid cluster-associated redox disulfide protein